MIKLCIKEQQLCKRTAWIKRIDDRNGKKNNNIGRNICRVSNTCNQWIMHNPAKKFNEISDKQMKYLFTKARNGGNTVTVYKLLIQNVQTPMIN